MEPIESAGAVEPREWFVVFHPEASTRWLVALAVGRFTVRTRVYICGWRWTPFVWVEWR